MAAHDTLADRFSGFTRDTSRRAPLYARLSESIAGDEALLELLAVAPREQQIPVLLFAAVHDLVLREPDLELGSWYPTVTQDPRDALDDDPFPTFARLCDVRREELAAVIATRSTQTNEVGRCAFYLPALACLASESSPLSLVDVGASAGLNLNLDRYEYRFEPGGSVGAPSVVVIDCGTRGDLPVPARVPPINARVGLDRAPIDTGDDGDARWLQACVWPDQLERMARLRGALAIARDHPVEVRRGDAVHDVAELVDEVARSGHPVVMNSWVLNYLSDDQRSAYVDALDAIGNRRNLSWVFAESPAQAPGLPYPGDRLDHDDLTAVVVVRWRSGHRTAEHVATAHPHGRWVHWRQMA